MIKSLVVTQMYGPQNVQGVGQLSSLYEFLDEAAELAAENLPNNPKINPQLMARLSFATQLACVIFKDWLFPDELANRNTMNDAIASFVMEGSAANTPSGGKNNSSRNKTVKAAS